MVLMYYFFNYISLFVVVKCIDLYINLQKNGVAYYYKFTNGVVNIYENQT